MVEPIMFFGIGFLFASLLGLVFIPLVHHRAVRLTHRRLEAATPLSMAEIQADKDQLRAEFAMSTRRLEMTVEQLKARTTNQFAELGKKTDAINRLKAELDEKTAAVVTFEASEKALREQLKALEDEYSLRHSGMREAERSLADKEAEFNKLSHELTDHSTTANSQRIEIAALRTEIDTLKAHIEDYEREIKETQARLDHKRGEMQTAARMLADERGKVENLTGRVPELERQLMAQTADTEMLGRHAVDLEARLAEQGRLMAEREKETVELRAALEAARQSESNLRTRFADVDQRHGGATETLRNEKAQAEAQLAQAREERASARRELAALQKDAEERWAAERVETALLRERINDVAAEMARLTLALEGPGSPIETILASDAARPRANGGGTHAKADGNGRSGPAGDAAEGTGGGSLVDRIRALQSRASRLPNPS